MSTTGFFSQQFPTPPAKLVWLGDSSRSFVQQAAAGGHSACVRRGPPSSSTICQFSKGQLLVTDAVPGLLIVTPDHGCWSDVSFQFQRTNAVGVATGRLLIFESFCAPNSHEVSYFSQCEAVLSEDREWWRFPSELVLRPATSYCLLAESVMPFAIGSGAAGAQMLAAESPGRPYKPLSGFAPLFCLRGTPVEPLPITWLKDSAAAV